MAPKKFQKVKVDQSKATSKVDPSDQLREPYYGEHQIFNCAIPYDGVRRSVNATVNPAELQRGIARQKQDIARRIAEHQEYRRVPKGVRTLKRERPLEEAHTPETKRVEH
jgi:hypothetical protein